eukprot:gene13668-19556_t
MMAMHIAARLFNSTAWVGDTPRDRQRAYARVKQHSFSIAELRESCVSDRMTKPVNFKSLDYEQVENMVYRADQAASTTVDSIYYSTHKWVICLLIGALTALAAFGVNFFVENISGFKFWATLSLIDKNWYVSSFVIYTLINCTLVVFAVLAFLNGVDVPGIFYVNTLVAKILGAIGSVAGGLAIGKEGPFVHAGAAIGAILSQGGPFAKHSPTMKRMWNDSDRNDFVVCGAAAGVAAAFRSPVGGVLFALEEMTSWWNNSILWYSFFTTAVVSVTVRLTQKVCSKQGCGFFGAGGFIIFEIAEGQDNYELYELLPVMLLGVVGGLLGASFIALNGRLGGRLVEGIVISLISSIVSFGFPLMMKCRACPEGVAGCPRLDNSEPGNFVSFGCTYGDEYNDLATIFFNTPDDAIRNLFSSKTKREYSVPALVTFYTLAVITYGITAPVGLFVPSILCGAAYGRLVGIFVVDMHPQHHIDEGTYALLGAASFLGGAMRMTVCTCVMLLELTNNLALLPLIMLVLLVAKYCMMTSCICVMLLELTNSLALLPLIMLVLLVAKAVGDGTGIKPIYEMQMEMKQLPFLDPNPEPFLSHITAKEGCGQPPVTFQRVEKVHQIVSVLKNSRHSGFPVMGSSGDAGDRSISSPFTCDASSKTATSFNISDFAKPVSTQGASIEDVQLTAEQMEMYIDLGLYVNPSYYVVQEDASLQKVYKLFRTLGLRHYNYESSIAPVPGVVQLLELYCTGSWCSTTTRALLNRFLVQYNY